MSIKIINYLFTGPAPIEKTARRANQAESIFAVVVKGGSAWDPVFRLIDLGRTGAAGIVFAEHSRVDTWRDAYGKPANIYLFDVTTQREAAADLDAVIATILDRYKLPADLK